MTNNSFKHSAVNGVKWMGISQVMTQALQFAFMVVLARIMLPSAFGIIGMAFIFTGLINMINELGLAAAIIQKQDVEDDHLNTAFWLGLLIGVVSFSISLVAAPLVANFFGKSTLQPLVMVIASGFIIHSFGIVHKTILNKKLDFKMLAVIEISSAAVYGAVTIALGLLGFGVWSLAIGYIASITAETLLLWVLTVWRPKLIFRFSAFRDLFSFGINVWLFNFVNYFRENIDYLVIGRYLGATPLGFYTLAYNLANLPRRRLASIIMRVTFPAFSKIQGDNARMSKAYLHTTSFISMVTFPLLTGLIVVAPQFVGIIYGTKWMPMVLPLRLLCVAGMLYSVGTPVGSIFMAKGRPDMQFKAGIVSAVAITVFVFIGLPFGVNGVAAAVATYTLLSLTALQGLASRLIDMKNRTFLRSLLPATVGSLVMSVVLTVFQILVYRFIVPSSSLLLISAVILGGLTYWFTMKIFNFKEYVSLIEIIEEQLKLRKETFPMGKGLAPAGSAREVTNAES